MKYVAVSLNNAQYCPYSTACRSKIHGCVDRRSREFFVSHYRRRRRRRRRLFSSLIIIVIRVVHYHHGNRIRDTR